MRFVAEQNFKFKVYKKNIGYKLQYKAIKIQKSIIKLSNNPITKIKNLKQRI